MKSTWKRFLSLVLCMCMVMALLPNVTMTAFAATSGTVTGLADENIGLSFAGDADDAWSANGTSITGSATSTGGTCSDTSHNSTLTIKNNKATTATLSFDYAIDAQGGTIEVDGTSVTADGTFSKELAAGGTATVYIKSGSTSAATTITLTNVVLVSDVNATTTFLPAENGTYTVDGKPITEEYSNTQSSMTAYQVVATPAEGYQFLGWYNLTTGKCIATAASTALNIESDCTITAKFASKSVALFETGGQRFDDLGDAVVYARTNGQSKITLATDGSISGTYTIPTGITLLIPFDEAGTLYTNAPAAIRTAPASRPFRTLTMSEGTSITVNGAISLGGRYFAAGGGQQGRPVGDYGYIKMADNSSITVKNGGNLYAWGFISGSGSILAESGATVYEFYQIADFRGGSASSNMGNSVFPFSQYFVQNIEAPLTLNAGANEQVYSGVYAMSTTYTTTINFIGDTGMFKVESGSFTKDYDEKTDRLVFTVNGEAALNTLSLTLAGMDVNSESYVLPITNNITINIQSGNVTINQNTALLAGVEVNIAEGAGLTVANGKSIYFYDSDEWNSDNFVWGPCKFKSVAYAPGKAYNRSNNDLVDAKMDVNGSVTAIGAIYTTGSGADICSSNGTGNYILQGAPGTATTTYQYNANGNKAVTIPITPAKLHNADDTYTETAKIAAGTTIPYANGKWEIPVCDHQWDEGVITTEPGCVTDGVKTYTCTICKETKTEVIPATGHTEVIDEAVEATCTTPGKTEGKHCSVCNEVIIAQTEVQAKGHTEVIDEAVEATCTKAGKTEGKHCSVCNTVLVAQEEIPAKGHTEVIDPAVAPTCTEPGKTEGKHCSVCNEVIVAQSEAPAKGHTEVIDAAVEATCTEPGKTEGKHCSVCNEITVAQEVIPAKGHTEVIDAAVEATCTEPGKTEGKHCSVCGEVITAQKEIPALGHSWGEWTVTTPASCTATGEETRTCDRCAATEKRELAKTGHREVVDPAVEATCTATGLTEGKHCSVCHAVIVAQEVVPMKEHTVVTVPGKAATCTEAGLTDGEKCSVCGKELKAQETIKALGHSWDEGKVTTAPTYEKTGVKTYTCGICKATKTESIPQLVNSGSGSSGGGSNKTTTYPVNIVTKTEDNGTTSSSSKMASKGNMVTITVEPDRYYVVDEVIIRDSRGKQLPVKDNGDGTYTFEMPADKVMVEPTFSWVNPFVDVKNTAYYTSAVEWTLKRMITQGTTDITFTPNGSCTRAHIVTFLWRAAGSPEPESAVSFADVPAGSYYAKAVAWAVENGITLGTTDVTFSPNAACTRAQSVTFLYRASEASASGAPTFYDVAEDAYYAAAVKWATDNGITNGIGNGLFGSNNTCTRAQIVTFLWRSYMGK